MKTRLAFLATCGFALVGGTAGAGIIFDNGPTNGNLNAAFISGPNFGNDSLYDTFTATGSGAVGELQFGLWVPHGETPTSITWWLGSTFLDNSLGGGTVSLTSSNSVLDISNNGFAYDVYEITLTGLTSSTLTAGNSYVLTLGNASDSSGDSFAAWDVNDGPAACGLVISGADQGSCTPFGFGSEAFTLSTSGSPEPATWALMLAGFAGLGAAVRSRRTNSATA